MDATSSDDIHPEQQEDPRDVCDFCKTRGHSEEHCPDREWKQYQATLVQNETAVPVNPTRAVYCCNCAKQGHFVDECTEERMDPSVLIAYADIVAYIYKQKHEKGEAWPRVSIKKCYTDSEEDDEPRAKKMKFN